MGHDIFIGDIGKEKELKKNKREVIKRELRGTIRKEKQ